MTTTAIAHLSPKEVLPHWLEELQAGDRAKGTLRRNKCAVEGSLAWYFREEQRLLTFSAFTPIALVGDRNYVQCTQHRATSTVNGQISALRAFCAWLTEEHYLEINPAKCLKLVGREEASTRSGLNDTQVNVLLRQARSSRDSLRNYTIVQMLLQTGMGLDECSQLALDDIEFGARSGQATIRQGKGNRMRVVPLNTSARQALTGYMAPRLNCEPNVRAVVRVFPRHSSDRLSAPLWQSQKKGILTTSAMRQMIDRYDKNLWPTYHRVACNTSGRTAAKCLQ